MLGSESVATKTLAIKCIDNKYINYRKNYRKFLITDILALGIQNANYFVY